MLKHYFIVFACLTTISCNPDCADPSAAKELRDYLTKENADLKILVEQLKKDLAEKEAELEDCNRKLTKKPLVPTGVKPVEPAPKSSPIQPSDLVGDWSAKWKFESRTGECGVTEVEKPKICSISLTAIGLVVDGQKAVLNNREIFFEDVEGTIPYRYSTLVVKNTKEIEGYVHEYYERRGSKFLPVKDKRDRKDCTVTYTLKLTRN